MSEASGMRKARLLTLALLAVLTLSLVMAGSASAEGGPYVETPGYPKIGCYDVVSAGMGMFTGNTLWPLVLRVPGPVVDAYMIWAGTEDVGAPGSPNQSDLAVNGTNVIGTKIDTYSFSFGPPWYLWRANLGPHGANLVQQGYNSFTITGWYAVPEYFKRNGVSIVAIYDTGACTRPNKVDLMDNFDWYWEGTPGEQTTAPVVFDFPPALVNRSVTLWMHHGGTDHTDPCRPEQIWAAAGTGAKPTNLINYGSPSTGVNGGVLILTEAFSPNTCGGTSHPPVTFLDGGYIDPEWSLIQVKIDVPAGATWLAVQGESVKTGTGLGESGIWFVDASIPLYNPELRITKTDGKTNANPGDSLTYTINYDNHGYGPAENTTIVDTLPERMTFVGASGGGVYDPATRKITWNLGTVNNGVSGQLTVQVTLDPVYPAGTTTLTNNVTISTTTIGEQDTSDNAASDTTNVFAKVELAITKVAAPEPVEAGAPLTYTIGWIVNGNAFATGVTIVDTLPQTVTFVSASDGGVFDPATRKVTWSLGTVTPLKSGTYTIKVNVQTPLYNGTKLPNSVVIADTIPGDPTKSASTVTTVHSAHVLAVTKTDAPDPVEAGANLTYTINWSVTGNEPARDAKVVDTLPDHVTFVSATGGGVYDSATRKITWNLGELMTPQNGSFTVIVKVDTPLYNQTRLNNVVNFSDTTPGSTPVSTTQETTVHSAHVLAVAKVDNPDPVEAGANLTYTITWSTTGNEPARDALIVDTLPNLVSFISATGGGVYDSATRKITWNLGELMTPQNGEFVVVVKVNTPLYDQTKLNNVVVFSDTTPGSTPANASQETTVHADHELSIVKSDAPDPVEKGANLTYTLDWAVTGNEPADNVIVTDPLPFGTQFVSATGGGVYDPATDIVTWNLGTQMTPKNGTLTLVVKVNRDFPNRLDIPNRATIKDDKAGKEKHADALTAVVQTPEGSIGDTVWYDANRNGIQEPGEPGIGGVGLILYKAGPDGQCGTADDVAMGNAVTDALGKYLFNEVAAGAYCVKVLDATVPAGLTLTGGTNPHGPIALTEGQEYRNADFGYGPATGTGVIGDRVWSDADGDGVQDPGEIGIGNVTLNLLSAGADGRCDTADDTVIATKTTAPDGSYLFTGVAPGKYCVKVTDTNNVLTGLTLTGGTNPHGPITLAAGGTYLNADFGYHSTTTYNGQIGDLVFYDGNRSGVYDPGPGERGIEGVTLALMAPGADGVFGTADDVMVASTTTDANGQYLFTGLPDGQYQVVVTDLLGRLPGYTQTYGVPNTNNHGQVSPYPVTITGGNSVLTADFGYADGHLLDISKANNIPAGQPVEAGANMIYTINYGASGREPAPNVIISDLLPMQVDFVSASNGGIYNAATRTVTWSLGNLNPGDHGSVTLTVHVKKPLPNNSYIFNTVVISDDAKVTDEATDIVRVHAEPILTLTKTVNPTGTVKPGDTLHYSLCYANTGNGNATSVVLMDGIPDRTTYVTGSATGGGVYDAASRKLTWTVGTLGPDANVCVAFDVTVDLTLPGVTEVNQGWTVDNTATLDSAELPRLTRSTSNPLNAFVKPTLTKTANPAGTVNPGDSIRYELCYANEGTANLTGVVLMDGIPNRTTYVTGSATGGGVYDAATNKLTWTIGILGPNAHACVTFDVTIGLTLPGVTEVNQGWTVDNTATLDSVEVPRLTRSTSNPLNAFVKPTLIKTANPAGTVKPGDGILYTLCYANEGTANLTGVVLSDAIPVNTTYVAGSATGGGVYDAATNKLTWTIGILGPNANACVSFNVTVNMTIVGLTGQALSFAEWQAMSITNLATLKTDQVADKTATTVNDLNATVTLAIYKSVDSPLRHTGETVVFTVTATNQGTANANDVVLTDVIHPKLEEVTLTASKGTTGYDAATRMWTVNVGMLAPNETVTVVITGKTVRVPAGELPYRITNKATVVFREHEGHTQAHESNEVIVDVMYFLPGEVPEASTWLLLGSGLAGVAGYARLRLRARRRKSA